jgi:purine nucleosidase/pyrimidine-specific ribonucleoside hydrolase
MVGLNLTHQALATTEVVEKMKNMSHEVGQVAAAWMGFFGNSYNKVWNFEAPPVHDPCTIAALIEPDLIEWQKAFVVVETKGEWTRGATSVDLFKRWPDQEPNVYVAMKLDASRYWNLVLESVENVGRK